VPDASDRACAGGAGRHLLGGKVVHKPIAVDEIYSALCDDEEFARLPARLAEAFGGRSSLVQWHHSDGAAEVLAHSGYFSDAQLSRYAREFAQFDPWAEASQRHQLPNQAMDLETLVPGAVYERSRFYNEYVREMGDDTFRCLGVHIRNEHGSGMIAIQRGRSQKRYDEASVVRLSELAVHLRRMLTVRGKFASLRREATSLRSMIDCTPHAAMLVDESATLMFANEAAESLLRTGKLLRIRNGRLEEGSGAAADLLKGVRLACARPAEASSVRLQGRGSQQLLATLMPLPAASGRGKCLILVQDPAAERPGLARQLQSLYGLTAAEAAIARRLGDGLSLAEIAEERHVSLTTVRVQMKFLAQKMSCRRQAEVVASVNSIVPFAT